jgi:hypothetical protein
MTKQEFIEILKIPETCYKKFGCYRFGLYPFEESLTREEKDAQVLRDSLPESKDYFEIHKDAYDFLVAQRIKHIFRGTEYYFDNHEQLKRFVDCCENALLALDDGDEVE